MIKRFAGIKPVAANNTNKRPDQNSSEYHFTGFGTLVREQSRAGNWAS